MTEERGSPVLVGAGNDVGDRRIRPRSREQGCLAVLGRELILPLSDFGIAFSGPVQKCHVFGGA